MEVLLLAGKRPLMATIEDVVRELADLGAQTYLVCMTPAAAEPSTRLVGVRDLTAAADSRGAAFWRRSYAESFPVRMWMHVRADRPTLRRGRDADVLVALDQDAVYSVWRLAGLNPTAQARLGLGPGLDAARALAASRPASVDEAALEVPPVSDAVRLRHRLGRGIRSLRGLRAQTGPPPTPTESAAPPDGAVSPTVERSTNAADGAEAAPAQPQPADPLDVLRAPADQLSAAVSGALAEGRLPPLLAEAVAAELDYTDALLETGEWAAAAASFLQACRLGFHPVAHPQRPVGRGELQASVLSTLHASRVFSVLATPADRPRPDADAGAGADAIRRRRVLVVSADRDRSTLVHALLDSHLEVQTVDSGDLGTLGAGARNPVRLIESVLAGDGRAAARAEEGLAGWRDWAELIVLDGLTALAYAVTLADLSAVRVVARTGVGDLLTVWPQLVDGGQVDQIVVESDEARAAVVASVPAAARAVLPVRVLSDDAALVALLQ